MPLQYSQPSVTATIILCKSKALSAFALCFNFSEAEHGRSRRAELKWFNFSSGQFEAARDLKSGGWFYSGIHKGNLCTWIILVNVIQI